MTNISCDSFFFFLVYYLLPLRSSNGAATDPMGRCFCQSYSVQLKLTGEKNFIKWLDRNLDCRGMFRNLWL
ncbi:hypothetical protein FB446DRAFT_84712 [Lentinula raphanica]|nr:hypothetical protein FB446DRAFT_84712 [Lentinula raphanica]